MFISDIIFILHNALLINEHCNVQVSNDDPLKFKGYMTQLCRVIWGILFWHDLGGGGVFYSLEHRLKLNFFFLQSKRAVEECS